MGPRPVGVDRVRQTHARLHVVELPLAHGPPARGQVRRQEQVVAVEEEQQVAASVFDAGVAGCAALLGLGRRSRRQPSRPDRKACTTRGVSSVEPSSTTTTSAWAERPNSAWKTARASWTLCRERPTKGPKLQAVTTTESEFMGKVFVGGRTGRGQPYSEDGDCCGFGCGRRASLPEAPPGRIRTALRRGTARIGMRPVPQRPTGCRVDSGASPLGPRVDSSRQVPAAVDRVEAAAQGKPVVERILRARGLTRGLGRGTILP